MNAKLSAIYRFPVKGLTGEALDEAALSAGQALPNDRRYALEHGAFRFNSEAPEWQPKTHFLMLQRDERLAKLETRYDDAMETLTVFRGGKQIAKGKLTLPIGRTVLEDFFDAFMKNEAKNQVRIVDGGATFTFSDHKAPVLSIIGTASIKELERVLGREIDPLRFRANLVVETKTPWVEFDWVGAEITCGTAKLTVRDRIDRCAAINVNPKTAERDLNIPKLLMSAFGHIDFGVYARVDADGVIRVGDSVAAPG